MVSSKIREEMHVSRISVFFSLQVAASWKYNEIKSIAKIPFSTKHVHLNPKPQNYEVEMTMICAHAQWHKHVFGQSHISLDTGNYNFTFQPDLEITS